MVVHISSIRREPNHPNLRKRCSLAPNMGGNWVDKEANFHVFSLQSGYHVYTLGILRKTILGYPYPSATETAEV